MTAMRRGPLLGRAALAAYRHPLYALLLAVAASAVAVVAAGRLGLDSDTTRLLPASSESVGHLERLRRTFGGVGYVVVLARGRDPAAVRRFADDLAPVLARLPSVAWVDHRVPTQFFDDHAAYWLEAADLERVAEGLEERWEWEVARRNPAFVDLGGAPPPLDFSDLRARQQERLESLPRARAYHTSDDGRTLAILVRPKAFASDLGFARRAVTEVERAVSARRAPGVTVELTGRYKKRVDLQATIQRDLTVSGLVAMVAMLLYVGLHFRRVSAVVVIIVPLSAGVLWTYGFAGAALGTLNLLTAFIGSVLLGMGIDLGIHLLGRFDEERAKGLGAEEAITGAFGGTGRAALAATLTTLAAFVCVATAELRAFREFGVIAAFGMLATFVAYWLMLPALIALTSVRRNEVASRATGAAHGRIASVLRWAPAGVWLSVIALVAVVAGLRSVRFDYDFASLDGAELRSYALDVEVNRLLGRSQTPAVVFGDRAGDAEAAARAIEAQRVRLGRRSTVARVVTTADLVPREIERKHELLERIGRVADRIAAHASELDPSTVRDLRELGRRAAARPFAWPDLPVAVRRAFGATDDAAPPEIALVFPAVSMSDGRASQSMARELRSVRTADGRRVVVAGEAFVLADVIGGVERDAPRIMGLALLAVALLLWITLGSAGRALLALLPALGTIAGTLAAMPALGLELNYLNIIVLPILLGMGVDGGAYVVSRWGAGEPLASVLESTGRAVVGALATTALGFSGLVLAHHPGLRSVGLLACTGMLVNLVATLVVLPAVLAVLRPASAGLDARSLDLAGWLSTAARAGLVPKGGGSIGALAAIPLAVVAAPLPVVVRVVGAVVLGLASILVVRRYCRGRPEDDPQDVVLDETVGCLLALAFVPTDWRWIAAAYLLFRLLDIAKPWPVSWIERRVHGPTGVVVDDLAAGLLAGAALATAYVAMGGRV